MDYFLPQCRYDFLRTIERGPGPGSALTILRHTSQVCWSWREAAESPILWARCLDFNVLDQRTDHWRTEVLRRTGTCDLDVRARAPGVVKYATKFFLHKILKENWHRIKTLIVRILPMDEALTNDEEWSIIYQPAATLRSFSLVFVPQRLPPIIEQGLHSDRKLFADHAPSLHTFHCTEYYTFIKPAVPLSSMSNVTTLQLDAAYIMSVFLPVLLSQVPQLERLYLLGNLAGSVNIHPTLKFHPVALSHLQYIHFGGPIQHCLELLERIIVPKYCSFNMRAITDQPPIVPLVDLFPILSQYATNYFATHCPTRLNLHFEGSQFAIVDFTIDSICRSSCISTIHFSQLLFLALQDREAAIHLIRSIDDHEDLQRAFASVTELNLIILPDADGHNMYEHEVFTQFLWKLFQSAEKLVITTKTLSVLHGVVSRISPGNSSVFPALKTLLVIGDRATLNAKDRKDLHKFLKDRRDEGRIVEYQGPR